MTPFQTYICLSANLGTFGIEISSFHWLSPAAAAQFQAFLSLNSVCLDRCLPRAGAGRTMQICWNSMLPVLVTCYKTTTFHSRRSTLTSGCPSMTASSRGLWWWWLVVGMGGSKPETWTDTATRATVCKQTMMTVRHSSLTNYSKYAVIWKAGLTFSKPSLSSFQTLCPTRLQWNSSALIFSPIDWGAQKGSWAGQKYVEGQETGRRNCRE